MKNSDIENNDFYSSIIDQTSDFEYVTKEVTDGIEWMIISVKIIYNIGEKQIYDTITSDWIATDADMM